MPVSPVPQKILREGAGGTNLGIGMGANHLRMIGTTISGVAAAVGSVVHAVAVDKGMFVDPMDEKIICYLAWGMLNYAVPILLPILYMVKMFSMMQVCCRTPIG
jgi:hypothetical protein